MLFEEKTQEALLEDLLLLVPDTTNKEEGTLIYSTLAAMAEKMEAIYIDVETATENTFADTADREHLIRIAAERGLEPTPATSAIYKAYFNCKIDIGDRFSADDTDYTLEVIEAKETSENRFYYLLRTEDTGLAVNGLAGLELEYIEGDSEEFEQGFIESLEAAAVDEQETEEFRQAYFDNARAIAFSGNIPAYINAVNSIKGVGACKITNQDNLIAITIIDEAMETPTDELVEKVQNIIDPDTDVNNWGKEYGLPELEDYKGKGYGLAPIDHDVLIEATTDIQLDINIQTELIQGYALDDVKETIKENVKAYIKSKRQKWKNTRNIKITENEIIAKLLNIEGVDDIASVKINNSNKAILEYNEIPILQNISIE